MKKLLSKIRRKLPSASPESCALLFVWFFLTIGLIVTVSSVAGEVTELAATSATKWQIIRECLFVAFSGCVLTAILAPLMGALCASVFMRRIVAEAYPAALVKRDFALADNGMLMGFIRQYKVGIYKTKSKLPDFVTYNVPARLDTLFPLPFYLPLFSLELIESGRICFEREEIVNIKKRTLDSLVTACRK